MRCTDARLLVSEYLDGELDPATACQLEEHLRTCPSCPPLAAALTGVLAQLRSLPETASGTVERALATIRTGSLGPAPPSPPTVPPPTVAPPTVPPRTVPDRAARTVPPGPLSTPPSPTAPPAPSTPPSPG
jgi:anti-sigma factor RsiW